MMSMLANLPIDITLHRVLSPKDTAAFLGVTVSQLRRMKREGVIPPPVRLSPRRDGWIIGRLIGWLSEREVEPFQSWDGGIDFAAPTREPEVSPIVPGFGARSLAAIMRGAV